MNEVKEYKLEVGKPSVNVQEMTEDEREMLAVWVEARRMLDRAEEVMKPMEQAVRTLVRRAGGSARAEEATLVVKPRNTGFKFSDEVEALAAELKGKQKTEKDLKIAVPKKSLVLEFNDHRKLPPLEDLPEEEAAEEAEVAVRETGLIPGMVGRVKGVLRRVLFSAAEKGELELDDEARGQG